MVKFSATFTVAAILFASLILPARAQFVGGVYVASGDVNSDAAPIVQAPIKTYLAPSRRTPGN